MMDKIALQDVKHNFKDTLVLRDQERKAKIKTLKDEKQLSMPDQMKVFHDIFEENSKQIGDDIKLIEEKKVEPCNLPEHFSKISKSLQSLNRYLSVSTVYLTNYNVRKSLQTIEDFENKAKELEAELLPKKRFGFKARRPKATDDIIKNQDEVDSSTVDKPLDRNSLLIHDTDVLASIAFGFSDKKDEVLKLGENDINKNDVELRNLQNCTVVLLGSPGTIHISNVKGSKILSGPVSTSVFVENCQDCDFVVACQQLRVHSTKNARFYIHVTSRAIIEDSTDVQFAPYNLTYEGIDSHYASSGLDKSMNNWNQVDDFNWLASDMSSPNWKAISQEERVQSWPIDT